MSRTIRDQVFTVLQKKKGIPYSIKGMEDALGGNATYKQVAGALADLAIFDDRVDRLSRGVYVYEGGKGELVIPNGVTAVHVGAADPTIDYSEKNARDTVEEAAAVGMPKLERTIAKAAGVFEEPEEENPDEGRYFTQVAVAENGDIILSRDIDLKAFRATPI